MIRLFAAMTKEGIIAINDELPCMLKDDLKFFRDQTLNRTVVMGRNTFKAMGKALPYRQNLVLTREPTQRDHDEHPEVFFLTPELLEHFDNFDVIGGAEIYRLFLQKRLVDEMYLTVMDLDVTEGVLTRFPLDAVHYDFDVLNPEIIANHLKDERNDAPFTIYKFSKRK